MPDSVITFNFQQPIIQGDSILGNIPILDIEYGNVWTNIPDTFLKKIRIKPGDSVSARFVQHDSLVFSGSMTYVTTFGAVSEKAPLAYVNSLMNVSFALNMANFADSFRIRSGPDWRVVLSRK